ncbi:preprotein translocase subunit YajC [Streptomyces sp. GC420]|uniref:preprotein translocase subunit YajC n=1 Tax=Streptomyces sp. GC420 TaxID=2697568 RepID=UPI001414D924|nr:preprotein translocase subunit YajC [Streptomyces sp. GC420]NBM16398.1 preprotein translocase subunit YajC [Streptomyces sp. GC420]
MNIVTLLPFIVLIGAMFLMTRSAKKKQQQAVHMREQMQPGTGIRTIGGMYATVKEVRDDTVLLEVAPGVHAVYAKNAVGAVLESDEYNRIVHGTGEDLKIDGSVVPDDASALTGTETATGSTDEPRIDLGKKAEDGTEDTAAEAKTDDGKADGNSDAK